MTMRDNMVPVAEIGNCDFQLCAAGTHHLVF